MELCSSIFSGVVKSLLEQRWIQIGNGNLEDGRKADFSKISDDELNHLSTGNESSARRRRGS